LFFENLLKWFEIVAARVSLLSEIYVRIFGLRVPQEISSLKISKCDKVLQIGCGAIPYTAEIIAKITGARVVAIDNDPRMVSMARDYLKRKGVKNVKVLCGDGIKFPLKNFTVIYVSLGVYPLGPILKKIVREGQGKRVIFRTSTNPLGRIYNKSAYINIQEEFLGGRVRKSKIFIL
jgi:protein-L-isoaspartate O-methyltransferase